MWIEFDSQTVSNERIQTFHDFLIELNCDGNFEFWSPGPKFSLENIVRLLKNRSGLKMLILGLLLKQENIKQQQINEG